MRALPEDTRWAEASVVVPGRRGSTAPWSRTIDGPIVSVDAAAQLVPIPRPQARRRTGSRVTGRPTAARAELLDVLRIAAALGVLLYHSRSSVGASYGALDPMVGSLDLGVLVFFSLSGYLVFGPFLRGPVDRTDHLVRRFVRIMPAYLVALVAALAIRPAELWSGHELQFALMLHLYDPALALDAMVVAWTLIAELAFYLALPVIVWSMARVGGPSHARRAGVLVALGAISLVARWAVLGSDEYAWVITGRLPPLWFWAFVPGMLIAYARVRSPAITDRLAGTPILVVSIGALASAVCLGHDDHGPTELTRMLVAAVASATMIPGLLRLRWPTIGGSTLAASGRTLSYPVYLWHMTVLAALASIGVAGLPAVAIAIPVTIVLAAGSWTLVERPTMSAARRWLGRRRTGAPQDGEQPASQVPAHGVRERVVSAG